MSKPAFSLIEVAIALALGMMTLGFLIHAQQVSSHQGKELEKRARLVASLGMTREEVQLATRGLDHEFWREFPRSLPLIHPVDHLHGALQFSASCPQHPESACLTFFDIRPRRNEPTLYQPIADDFPRIVRLEPVNGYGEDFDFQAQDVLFVTAASNSFCILIQELRVDELELFPAKTQPWPVADELPEDAMILGLGQLEVWHCYLEPTGEHDHQLVYEPWSIIDGAWAAGRTRSSQANLATLIFENCNEERPDRLTLVSYPPNAKPLKQPIQLAGQTFNREVVYDTLEF